MRTEECNPSSKECKTNAQFPTKNKRSFLMENLRNSLKPLNSVSDICFLFQQTLPPAVESYFSGFLSLFKLLISFQILSIDYREKNIKNEWHVSSLQYYVETMQQRNTCRKNLLLERFREEKFYFTFSKFLFHR